MDTSRFRAAGAGPPGPRTLVRERARPALHSSTCKLARRGQRHILDRGSAPGSASPVAAYRAAPVTRRAGGCPSAGHNKVGHYHHSRHGAPDASRNGGEGARSFRLVRLVIAARRSLPVEEGLGSSRWAARSLKNIFASRLWPSGLSRVAPRQSSTPAIELARWRAKSLGQF